MEFHKSISMAIDLAAKDIAKVTCDNYGLGTAYYSKIHRDARAMLSAAVAQSVQKVEKASWTREKGNQWLSRESDVNKMGWDEEALKVATSEWFKNLSTESKYDHAQSLAGQSDDVVAGTISQKFAAMAPQSVFNKYEGFRDAYEHQTTVSRSRETGPVEPEKPQQATPSSTEDIYEHSPPGTTPGPAPVT